MRPIAYNQIHHLSFEFTNPTRASWLMRDYMRKAIMLSNQTMIKNTIMKFNKLKIGFNDVEKVAEGLVNKQKHGDKLVRVRAEFEKNKRDLVKVFDDSKHVESEVKRVEVHMRNIKTKRIKTQEKKLPRNDTNDDRNEISSREEELTVATPAKVKRKRRFRRRYLQPQPKKIRKRRSERTVMGNSLPELWDGIVKNISDEPVSEIEKTLLEKGKKFAPVELDPPIIRMQRELNEFYRTLRIQWCFYGQDDKRSDLEKKFYKKSDWKPPKACLEIENFIKSDL